MDISFEEMIFLRSFDSKRNLVPMLIHMSGDLKVDCMLASMRRFICRHEILRTVFLLDGASVVRKVVEMDSSQLRFFDLTACSEDESNALYDAKIKDCMASIRLGCVMFRSVLFKRGEREYVLFTISDHMIFDFTSFNLLLKEVSSEYRRLLHREAESVEKFKAPQYRDFISWQKSWLTEKRMDKNLSFWRKKYDENPVRSVDLSSLRKPCVADKVFYSSIDVVLPEGLISRVRSYAISRNVTVYVVILAAFSATLADCSGMSDVSVSCPVSTRSKAEFRDVVGEFVNFIVVRNDVDQNLDVDTFVRSVMSEFSECFDHRFAPFSLLSDLYGNYDAQQSEVNVNCIFRMNTRMEHFDIPGVDITEKRIPTCFYDVVEVGKEESLMLLLGEADFGLKGEMVYNGEAFDRSAVVEFLDRLVFLLEAAMQNPGRALKDIFTDYASQAENLRCGLAPELAREKPGDDVVYLT